MLDSNVQGDDLHGNYTGPGETTIMHESTRITYSSPDAMEARRELFSTFQTYPATDDETERSLGLFVRGSLLARFLAIDEIYRLIVGLPGMIIDLGTWRGQTAVLCENLRAIHEPLHLNRRIACFDTFEGYKGFSDRDTPSELHSDGTYSVGGVEYSDLLSKLLVIHERCNAMGHVNGKHFVVRGDCRKTLPKFFEEHSNEVVSLAFFDVNSYIPTAESFDVIYARLVPAGIVAFWQLTRDIIPAEGRVYRERILSDHSHELFRSSYYPGLCYLVKR